MGRKPSACRMASSRSGPMMYQARYTDRMLRGREYLTAEEWRALIGMNVSVHAAAPGGPRVEFSGRVAGVRQNTVKLSEVVMVREMRRRRLLSRRRTEIEMMPDLELHTAQVGWVSTFEGHNT